MKAKEGGIAFGYSKGTTKTEAGGLNDLFQTLNKDTMNFLMGPLLNLDAGAATASTENGAEDTQAIGPHQCPAHNPAAKTNSC